MTPLAQVRKLCPASAWSSADGRVVREPLLALPDAARRSRADDDRRRSRRPRARGARGVGRLAPDERRAARRDAQRRPRLEPDRRADGAPHGRAGQDLRGRLLGHRRRQRARATPAASPTRSAPSTTSSSCRCSSDRDALASLAWHLDEPIADLSSLGFLALCELAAQHVTVALSGQGADELLGGYRRHALAVAGRRLAASCPARSATPPLPPPRASARPRAAELVDALQARDPVARMLGSIGLLHPELCARSCSRGALAEHAGAAERERAAHLDETPPAPCRSRPRCTSRPSSGWSTTGCTTSTARRWPGRSRSACRSSTITSSRRSRVAAVRQGPRTGGQARAAHAARGLVPDFVLDKPKLGFFSESVGSWLAAEGAARRRPGSCSTPEPRSPRSSTRRSCVAIVDRLARRRRPPRAAPCSRCDARAVARLLSPAGVRGESLRRSASVDLDGPVTDGSPVGHPSSRALPR